MDFHVHRRLVIIVTIVLALVLIFLCGTLVYKTFKIVPMRGNNPERISSLGKNHMPLGPNDVSMIASWMTFDYIDHVFALPSDYLKTTLGIADARYPQLSLSRSAKENNISENTFTARVQNAVKDYFAPSTTQ